VQTVNLDRFKAEYQDYNSLTEARRRDQGRALQSLCAFAGADEPTDCTPDDYKGWLRSLHEGEMTAITVKKYGMAVRPFFGWAFDAGLYDANYFLAIKRAPFPDFTKPQPRPYSAKEVKKLWPGIARAHPLDDGRFLERWRRGTSRYKRIEHHANHLQLTAICRIALDCGLRRQEIYDLDLDDMHYDNEYIVVREGKGDKFREVPYTKVANAAVREWIEFRTELAPMHDRPWLSLTKIGPEGVWLRPMRFERFAMYIHDAGPAWELHRLRHTCATSWLRAGMALEKVSRMLGHANLTQTMAYVKLVPDDVQREVERHEDAFAEQVA
jgi:site-specific recombinase XerD